MKKVLSLLLAGCLIFSLVGCGSNNNDTTSQSATIGTNSTPKLPQTEQEKYEQAAKYIEQEKYDDAIKILKEIPEYQDAKKHLYQAEFLYGCTLYNDKDFKNAHEHFESAYEILKNAFKDSNDSLVQKFKEDSKKYMYESAYYHAFDLLNNENYFAALDYFKETLNNYNYKFGGHYGPDYAENIMYKLLDGRWTGEISADGNKLYVEMIFDSRRMNDGNLIGDLHIKWFDSPNSLIAFDYSKGRFAAHTDSSYLSDDVNNETISLEFDFKSSNKVDVVVNKVFIGANNSKYAGTLTKEEDGDCESYKIGFTPTTININQYVFSRFENAEINAEVKLKVDEYLKTHMPEYEYTLMRDVDGNNSDIYTYESGLVIYRSPGTDDELFSILVASEETETSPASKELCFNTMIPLLSAVGVECDLSISQFDEKLILKEEGGNGQIWKTYEYQYSEEILFEVMVVEDPGRQVLYEIMCRVLKK